MRTVFHAVQLIMPVLYRRRTGLGRNRDWFKLFCTNVSPTTVLLARIQYAPELIPSKIPRRIAALPFLNSLRLVLCFNPVISAVSAVFSSPQGNPRPPCLPFFTVQRQATPVPQNLPLTRALATHSTCEPWHWASGSRSIHTNAGTGGGDHVRRRATAGMFEGKFISTHAFAACQRTRGLRFTSSPI